jgi:glycosyltransferase involved in cell wall biosynthesis
VLVGRETYTPRYDSADVVEYEEAARRRTDRYVDVAAGRLGLPRPAQRRALAAALSAQGSWEPGVVLAHNAPQAVPLVDARHAAVLYAHNQLLRTYRPAEARRTLDAAALVVCVSSFLAERTAAQLPGSLRDRVEVVLNGVDPALQPREGRRRGDRLRVAFVGRMIHDKGPDVLLDAVASLDRDDVELVLVGADGFDASAPLTPYERALVRKVDETRAPVTRTGFLPRAQVHALLADVDVVVVPSRWEDPCPLTLFEGMGVGAAVVATTLGGIPEVVGDAGLLVPPDDSSALAAVIESLADDEALLEKARSAATERGRVLTWERSLGDLERAIARHT